VSGVKGDKEDTYRTGNVNITPANIGASTDHHTHGITELTLSITTIAQTSNINIASLEYVPGKDILHVYINGLKLTTDEYTIDNSVVTLSNAMPAGNTIEVAVIGIEQVDE
jgi:hypothetical protein